jgi:hypothetical protein
VASNAAAGKSGQHYFHDASSKLRVALARLAGKDLSAEGWSPIGPINGAMLLTSCSNWRQKEAIFQEMAPNVRIT